jgi:hypothetical protein
MADSTAPMIDAQTVRGGRAGLRFHEHGGRGHGHTDVAVLAARRNPGLNIPSRTLGNRLKKPKHLFTTL